MIQHHAIPDTRFELRQRLATGGTGLYALSSFDPGEILTGFSARATLGRPAVHTIQVSASEHILLDPEFLQYTNHSCSPNVIFDVRRRVMAAVKTIRPGHEIVYFYPSTETEMAQPFRCTCDSPRCLGWIAGANRIPTAVLDRYSLTDHVRALIDERESLRLVHL